MDPPARSGIRRAFEEVLIYHSAHNRTCRRIRTDTTPTRWRPPMEWLRRSAAPLSEKVWKEVDEIAGSMFKQTVVARRIVDFDVPRGWNHAATQLGTFKPADTPKSPGNDRFSIPDVMLLTE